MSLSENHRRAIRTWFKGLYRSPYYNTTNNSDINRAMNFMLTRPNDHALLLLPSPRLFERLRMLVTNFESLRKTKEQGIKQRQELYKAAHGLLNLGKKWRGPKNNNKKNGNGGGGNTLQTALRVLGNKKKK